MQEKKEYEKPDIIFEKQMETLAGFCDSAWISPAVACMTGFCDLPNS